MRPRFTSLLSVGLLAACAHGGATRAPLGSAAPDVDHVIVGVDSLERGVEMLRAATGVAPAIGGVHPGRGTRNALLALGNGQYLELMAPDPAQPRTPRSEPLFALRALAPIGWAARTRNADSLRAALVARGVPASPVAPGGRRRPDGATLRWRVFDPWGVESDVLPFVIEWDVTATHPAADAPAGCTLAGFVLASPAPDTLRARLAQAGFRVEVRAASREALSITLACPKGRVRFGPDAP
jgi:hypothetical protein